MEPTDTIASLKEWLVKRNLYACMNLKHGSKRLVYDFLTFAEYGIIRDGTTLRLRVRGLPGGAKGHGLNIFVVGPLSDVHHRLSPQLLQGTSRELLAFIISRDGLQHMPSLALFHNGCIVSDTQQLNTFQDGTVLRARLFCLRGGSSTRVSPEPMNIAPV